MSREAQMEIVKNREFEAVDRSIVSI